MLGSPLRLVGRGTLIRIVLVALFLTGVHFLIFNTVLSTPSLQVQLDQDLPDYGGHHRFKGGRIVVTGGAGNIGKHLVRRLLNTSTPVTILDTIIYDDELKSFPNCHLLRTHVSDIRNETALKTVLTSDVVGVVHLAAVSRVVWCLNNEPDCMDVNERGTRLILDGLLRLHRQDKVKRWFILASSREVYGNNPGEDLVVEDSPLEPANTYGLSKAAAETVLQKFLSSPQNADGVYAIALRLSNVYGGVHDHLERLIPSIITNALSHQVIQIVGGKQHFDLLHIDECVDAFMLAIHRLSETVQWWSLSLRSRASLETFNVASGESAPVGFIVDTVIGVTKSKSPIRYIPGDSRYPNVYRGSTEKAQRVLGFRALVSVEEGLLRLVHAYLNRTADYLETTIQRTCGAASPSIAINLRLEKLQDCNVRVDVDVQGQFATLNRREYGDWEALHVLSFKSLIPNVIRSLDNKGFRVRLRDDAWTFLGVRDAKPGSVTLAAMYPHEFSQSNVGEWDVAINPEQGTLRLTVPGTNYRLVGPPIVGAKFHLVDDNSDDSFFVWRFTPTCCPGPSPWPFFRDDPHVFTTDFQKTETHHPFLASPAKALCNRLETARFKLVSDLSTFTKSAQNMSQPRRSSHPEDWSKADLPACTNLCDHPTICVDTGDCQCVVSRCVPRLRFPFTHSSNTQTQSYPPIMLPPGHKVESLAEIVARSSWKTVLQDQASRFVGMALELPKLHVAALSVYDTERTKANSVGALSQMHCFSADASMERAVKILGVQASEADKIFIPYYGGHGDQAWHHEGYYKHVANEIQDFDSTKIVSPFTHDWGQCMDFEWDLWSMREKIGLRQPAHIRSTTALSVMGDLNSRCFRPHQDVVIPPRTCLSPDLVDRFGNMTNVLRARERPIFATFHGTPWGTGVSTRNKLTCYRDGWKEGGTEHRFTPNGPALRTVWGVKAGDAYLDLLGKAVFCPQAAGTTGWATRLVDAMYAGCIPVFVGQTAQQPFWDVLDWSKISVEVDPSKLSHLEDVLLRRYSLEDIERMQVNIMLVRNAFLYPLDHATDVDVKDQMLNQRGPLYYALVATQMRMLTNWPVDATESR